MTTCLCGATGFYNRRELAQHIVDKHGANAPRALTLAQRIIDKLKLAPEDYAVFGIETPAQTAAPSRAQREAADAPPALPSPEVVRAAVEALHPSHSIPPAAASICSCCKERPAQPGKKWCPECIGVARERSSRPRGARKATVVEEGADPLDAVDAPEEPLTGEWGNGARRRNLREAQVEPASPITCPRCPNQYGRRFELINHLVMLHGLNSTEAMNLAQDTEKQQERAARVAQPIERRTTSAEVAGSSPAPRSTPEQKAAHGTDAQASGLNAGERVAGVGRVASSTPTPETPVISPAPKETPMAEQKKCADCNKPFTPTNGRQSKCDDCARCGGCKQLRSAGHKEWCPRAKKGKKAAGGGKKKAKARVAKRGQRPTRETARPVAETPVAAFLDGNGTRKKAEALLLDLRDLRMKLDVKISHVEELVTIL